MSKAKNKKTLRSFTVDRATWGRGLDGNKLLENDDLMCCLGFLCTAAGVSKENIMNRPYPNSVPENEGKKLPAWMRRHWAEGEPNMPTCSSIAKVNDDPHINPQVRERMLVEMFAKHGLKIKFKGRNTRYYIEKRKKILNKAKVTNV